MGLFDCFVNLFGDTIVRWTTNCVTSKCQCYVSCLTALKRPHSVSLRKISTIKNLSKTLCATGHPQHGSFFRPQNIIQTVSKPVPAPSLCMCAHFTAWRALCICPQTLLLISLFHFFLRSLTNPANKCLFAVPHLTTPTTTTTATARRIKVSPTTLTTSKRSNNGVISIRSRQILHHFRTCITDESWFHIQKRFV